MADTPKETPPLCLFDQRLLRTCEARIQDALMTENSKTCMLLVDNTNSGGCGGIFRYGNTNKGREAASALDFVE